MRIRSKKEKIKQTLGDEDERSSRDEFDEFNSSSGFKLFHRF